MSLQVLVVGRLRPDLGRRADHLGVALADLRHDDAVLEAAEERSVPGEPVVLVCEARSAVAARRAQVLAAVALPRSPVLLRPVAATPLGVWTLAAAAADLADGADAGTGLAVLGELATRLWSAVWTPTVRRLEDPAPRLAQHARSWLPGGSFLAEPGAPGRVTAAPGRLTPAAPPGREGPRVLRHTPVTTSSLDWLVPEAVRTTSPDAVETTTSWRDPIDAYGSATAVELALLPTAGVREQAATGLLLCDGCGRSRPLGTCPFCGMRIDVHPLQEAS